MLRIPVFAGGLATGLILSRPVYGAGGGENLIEPLGVMLLAAAILVILLRYVKQASLLAFIIVGVFGGAFGLKEVINTNVMTAFVDIGITLLLFMAGMEVDIPGLLRRWKLLLINGFGQVGGLMLLCIGIGLYYMGIDGSYMLAAGLPAENAGTAVIYFALCLTLSSTILVVGALKKGGHMSKEHGQITLGLMVLQDVVAVSAVISPVFATELRSA